MAKKRRPCPRGLFDGCPIPRELCTEDKQRTGAWHCLQHLQEFERFVFGTTPEADPDDEYAETGDVTSLEDLLRVLRGEET